MDPITMMFLASTVVSAGAQIGAGISAKKAADLNAFNIETDRKLGKAEAINRHNDRLELYQSNLSTNIAQFAAQGRDVSSDRSIAAFLEKQKKTAARDASRSDLMGAMDAAKLASQAQAVRADGRAQQTSAFIGAFTTLAGGLNSYNQVKTPTSSSSLAPATSPRPQARPY